MLGGRVTFRFLSVTGAFWARAVGSLVWPVGSVSAAARRNFRATGRKTESDWMILIWVARNWSASLGAMRAASWPTTAGGAWRSISMVEVDS